MDKKELAGYIDATILSPAATHADIKNVCDKAVMYGCASVCVNSLNVYACHKFLKGTGIKTCSVVGFPFGATASAAKAFEAACAVEDGAEEIDMVMDIASAKFGDFRKVEDDIAEVVDACDGRAIVKVIIECCLLTDEEKKLACIAAKNGGADFVKTSTGYQESGATVSDVALMKETVGDSMGVKAAGGIRDFDTAVRMIEAGATRIGASRLDDILG